MREHSKPNQRAVFFGIQLALVFLLAACGPSQPPSCASTCGGCCTPDGRCLSGTTDSACGVFGNVCTGCAAENTCASGLCIARGGFGGGSVAQGGGSAGGVSLAGGAAGGDAAGGSAGGGSSAGGVASGGGLAPNTTVTVVVGGGPGAVSWTSDGAQGVCAPDCVNTGAAGRTFTANVVQSELGGLALQTSRCGTAMGKCSVPADTNMMLRFDFQPHVGSPLPSGVHTFSTATNGRAEQLSLAGAPSGGFAMSGATWGGNLNLGGSALTTGGNFLARFDEQGQHLWSFVIDEKPDALAFDPSGGLVSGGVCPGGAKLGGTARTTASGPCVIRYDGQGVLQSGTSWPGTATVSSVATASTGDIAIGGSVSGTFSLGASLPSRGGSNDVYVAVLGSNGQPRFAKRLGGGADDSLGGVAFDSMNRLVVAFWVRGPATIEGLRGTAANFQWSTFVLRYDAAGTFVDGRVFNSTGGTASTKGLTRAADGRLLLSGSFSGTLDLGTGGIFAGAGLSAFEFVAALDPTTLATTRVMTGRGFIRNAVGSSDGSTFVIAESYAATDWGGGTLVGDTATFSATSTVLVRFDPQGRHQWSKLIARGVESAVTVSSAHVV
ncbi:MAG: hypothetical protein JNM69_09255, partial [Archangium sp.]|nr:hypothetical protein [Archangium sp.]